MSSFVSFPRSLKARVTVLTLLVFVISIWSLAFYATHMLREDMQRQLGEQQFSTISFVAKEIDQELTERLNALELVAASITPAIFNDHASLQAMLEQRPVFLHLFNAGLFVTGADGTAIADVPRSAGRIGINYIDRESIAVPLREGKSVIGQPNMGKTLLAPIFSMVVPIRDTHGKVVGVLAGTVNLGLPNFLDQLTTGRYGKTGNYLLVAPQHKLFVTASDKSRVMQPLPAPGINPMHDKYMSGYEGYGVATSSRGTEELSAAKSIPAAGWFIVAILPTEEAFAPIYKMQRRMLMATILLTLLAGGLIGWLISLLLKRQLAPMLVAARALAVQSASDQPVKRLHVARPDEIGELIGGFNQLLTNQAKREDALRESEALYRSVVDHGQALIWLAGLDKGCYYFNQPWLAFTGRTLEQELGNGWVEGVHPDDLQRCLDIYLTAFDRREKFSMIYRLRAHDGEYRWILDDGAPRYDSAQVFAGYVGHCLDITERQQAQMQLAEQSVQMESRIERRTRELSHALEAAKLADQTKDAFLANMSHELRTPLSAVIGMADMALTLSTDARQRDYLNKITTAGKHLNRIINDLLDLSKIAAGYMEFETIPLSLHALVQRCNSVMGSRALEKGLELVHTIDDAVPDVLLGDPLRIEQILLNLVGNAIKFTPAGRIDVRVRQHEREENRICLAIEVEDSGVGMCCEDLDRLFKPFSQADATVSRKFGGTGLGLAISKRLAEMMGGDISVTSREGSGTTFLVLLWMAVGDAADLADSEASDAETLPVRYLNTRVLVAEDQALNREIVESMLAAVGITPRMAENGQEALDILLEAGPDAFDLVLMDIQMPVMDGLAAIRALRAQPGFGSLPVMAMTAHTMKHEKEISIVAGMNDHIAKPFDNASFYRTLAKWIPASKHQAGPGPAPVALAEPPAPLHSAAKNLYALHGIDARNGLGRFNGKEDRYLHWLGDFAATAGALTGKLRSEIAAANHDEASRKIHAFKGRVGMLGMTDLHRMIAAVEVAVNGGKPADELFAALEREIALICADLAEFLAGPATEATHAPLAGAKMVWDASYSVGVARIDVQHKKLISMINQLADLQSGKAVPPSGSFHELLADIFDYTETHFKTEEDYMAEIGYSAFVDHAKEHAGFVEKMVSYDIAALDGVLDRKAMHQYLMEWVLAHILQSDMQYRDFAKEKKFA